jgi:hypothetical protein
MLRAEGVRRIVLPGAVLALSACAAPSVSSPGGSATASAQPAAAPITAAAIRERIAFLASDEMRGRDTPSPELELAAEYLARESRALGLEAAGEGGTFLQRWPYPLRRLDTGAARMSIRGPRGTQTLRLGEHFAVTGGAAADFEGGLVFVGQQTAPNAASDGTLRERVAVAVLPGAGGQAWAQLRARQVAQARAAGARAVIHVLDPSFPANQMREMAERAGTPARAFGAPQPFPSFLLSHTAARQLFSAADLSLDESWRRAVAGDVPALALPGLTFAASAPVQTVQDAMPPNVAAVLRGSDPVLRDEYVVLSAHFDHVGVGRPVGGDSIYNGADDNASGTAGILEVARAMAALPVRPRRSVIFLWVSGEEKGLLGSRWYADNPTVPIERIVANINVDMIGGDRHRDSVVVIGKDFSDLGGVVNRTNARLPDLRLVASDDIWPQQRFFFRSDHFNFARREVPAIFFFTGVHECYHLPCDTVEFVNHDKAARVANLIFHTALEIANADRRPVWDPAGLEQVRALTR